MAVWRATEDYNQIYAFTQFWLVQYLESYQEWKNHATAFYTFITSLDYFKYTLLRDIFEDHSEPSINSECSALVNNWHLPLGAY